MTGMDSRDVVRARLVIAGRVQGVGFRAFARERAVRLALRGWVRNLPDGRVEAAIEGDAAGVNECIQDLTRGPSLARVDDARVEWLHPHHGDADFAILD